MVYTNYTLKPRLENIQTIFFNTLKLYSAQILNSSANREQKNAIFPLPHDKILTADRSEKERFSVNRLIKKKLNRQTDRL